MTEPETKPDEMPVLPITFRDREVYVTMPSPTQLAVWKRILQRLQSTSEDSWTADAVVDELARLHTIVETLLVEPADKRWLEDEMLAGRIDFRGLAPIVTQATEAFRAAAEGDNRVSKRAAKKATAKKAGLKAPGKKA